MTQEREFKPLFDTPHLMNEPIIIAGPCSAESERQVLDIAHELASHGVSIFRAGIWKPRTMPGSFEGVGTIGLNWLKKVKEETGMLVATEVANSLHTIAALQAGVDVLWVGARTTSSPFAIREIAETIMLYAPDTPVLIKNPLNPDIDLWCGAIMRMHDVGVKRIGAIHRGFSTFGKHIYRNNPIWSIPFEFARRFPQIPLICDPSHIAGTRVLVEPLAQQAMRMGFNGLMIETHNHPEYAYSDGNQQLTPTEFFDLISGLEIKRNNPEFPDLDILRSDIDNIDDEILNLIATRMDISRKIGEYKKDHDMKVLQPNRFNEVMKSRISIGNKLNLPPNLVTKIMSAIHEESVNRQIYI